MHEKVALMHNTTLLSNFISSAIDRKRKKIKQLYNATQRNDSIDRLSYI